MKEIIGKLFNLEKMEEPKSPNHTFQVAYSDYNIKNESAEIIRKRYIEVMKVMKAKKYKDRIAKYRKILKILQLKRCIIENQTELDHVNDLIYQTREFLNRNLFQLLKIQHNVYNWNQLNY